MISSLKKPMRLGFPLSLIHILEVRNVSKNATTYSVLVASESKDYLLVIKNHTEKMGIFHDCCFAFNGEDALEKFREKKPDLFLSLIHI